MRNVITGLLASAALAGCSKPKPAPDPQPDPQPERQAEPEPHPEPKAQPALPAFVEVPTEAKALQAWLAAGHYKAWAHESEKHVSEGPHAEEVLTFLSPQLDASLAAGLAEHGKGAAAVKELYDEAGAHLGWAVSVKLAEQSADGKRWFWYEVFSTDPAAKADYQGEGVEICRECHADGGRDQVLITYPLP